MPRKAHVDGEVKQRLALVIGNEPITSLELEMGSVSITIMNGMILYPAKLSRLEVNGVSKLHVPVVGETAGTGEAGKGEGNEPAPANGKPKSK